MHGHHPDDTAITVNGRRFRVTFQHDHDADPPWDAADGHGPVTDWLTRDKAPGERVIAGDGRSSRRRFYDFAEAVKIAKRDQWGVEGGKRENETDDAYAARAVEEDFTFLRAWCVDEWSYVGVIVTRLGLGNTPTGESDALWGVETWKDYHLTQAREMAEQMLASELRSLTDALGTTPTDAACADALMGAETRCRHCGVVLTRAVHELLWRDATGSNLCAPGRRSHEVEAR